MVLRGGGLRVDVDEPESLCVPAEVVEHHLDEQALQLLVEDAPGANLQSELGVVDDDCLDFRVAEHPLEHLVELRRSGLDVGATRSQELKRDAVAAADPDPVAEQRGGVDDHVLVVDALVVVCDLDVLALHLGGRVIRRVQSEPSLQAGDDPALGILPGELRADLDDERLLLHRDPVDRGAAEQCGDQGGRGLIELIGHALQAETVAHQVVHRLVGNHALRVELALVRADQRFYYDCVCYHR